MEYGHFPNRKDANKYVIISDQKIDNNIKKYLDTLNENYNLNIGLINYCIKEKQIIEKYNLNECDFA